MDVAKIAYAKCVSEMRPILQYAENSNSRRVASKEEKKRGRTKTSRVQCCRNKGEKLLGEEEKGQQVDSDAGPDKEVTVTWQEQFSGGVGARVEL
mgnify:CR=1 FL=1